MPKLDISIAVGDYDRTRPLVSGSVLIEGADPKFILLEPEEMFFRGFRNAEFDVCELSLSSFATQIAKQSCKYIGVPVFLSRAFRHTSIYIRKDRGIYQPSDLRGKKVGTPEYQLTANVWVRAILEEEYGVRPSDIEWVLGGYEHPGRKEKIPIKLPPDIHIELAPDGATISEMLDQGELDAVIGPRAPSCFGRNPTIAWVFEDPASEAADWFRRRRIFPIMHMLGVRASLANEYPWLANSLFKAFQEAKTVATTKLSDTSATKVTLPFVEEHLLEARKLMGSDFWPYGFRENRQVLEEFLRHHYRQSLSEKLLRPEDLFSPSTLEMFRI